MSFERKQGQGREEKRRKLVKVSGSVSLSPPLRDPILRHSTTHLIRTKSDIRIPRATSTSPPASTLIRCSLRRRIARSTCRVQIRHGREVQLCQPGYDLGGVGGRDDIESRVGSRSEDDWYRGREGGRAKVSDETTASFFKRVDGRRGEREREERTVRDGGSTGIGSSSTRRDCRIKRAAEREIKPKRE